MGKIKIYIKDIHGNLVEVEVDSSDTIANGKKVYLLKTNCGNDNFSCQWFIQGNVLLEDDETFGAYDMEDGDIIIQKELLKTPLLPKPNRLQFIYSDKFYSDKLRQESKKVKPLLICNIITDEKRELNIGMDKTVKELKKEIEKLFNLSYSLDNTALEIKRNGIRNARIIREEDENKTLFEFNFKTYDLVYFGCK